MTALLNYRITTDAQNDLIKIRQYTLIQWGEKQSKKYISELRNTIGFLSQSPLIGKQQPELGSDIFSFPHSSHVIYFIIHKQQLVVFAVLHKCMVPLNHLEDRLIT